MTAIILPRQYGVKLVCNGCGATQRTAMCGIRASRKWFATHGWGRGSYRGSRYRTPTTSYDLCPVCLAVDHTAKAARGARRAAQITARDAKRKQRAA